MFVFVNLGQQYEPIFRRMHSFLPYNTLMIALLLAICLAQAVRNVERLTEVGQWEEKCHKVAHCMVVVLPDGMIESLRIVEEVADDSTFAYFWILEGDHPRF